ncbi:recombinase family protein [Saccharopolyspora shandongensis]|uniref:recombinase family protein n=1 Tax=Saccharopolyspora shandongensis TaxID=418495 RepID=UPI00341AEB7F
MHQLEPDPVTAPWVRWIFQQRAAGRSMAGIARELNDRGMPCPSGADPGRNPHCSGQAWMTPTVAGILENPRYTGRQVWNRHGTVRSHRDAGRAGGVGGRTNAEEWAVSNASAHALLELQDEFDENGPVGALGPPMPSWDSHCPTWTISRTLSRTCIGPWKSVTSH